MSDDRILFSIHDRTCFIRVQGEATHSTTSGFGDFIDALFDRCDFDDVLVDLSETTYIDSTNLGELTKLSSFLMERRRRRPILVSTRPSINSIITSLGMDCIFDMVDKVLAMPPAMIAVPAATKTPRENALRILEAHRYLVALNEKTGREFRSVVDAFERELGIKPKDTGS